MYLPRTCHANVRKHQVHSVLRDRPGPVTCERQERGSVQLDHCESPRVLIFLLENRVSAVGPYCGQAMESVEYVYELRRGDEIIVTGRLSRDRPLEIGDRLEIAQREGIVRVIEPILGEGALRLVLQLVRTDD